MSTKTKAKAAPAPITIPPFTDLSKITRNYKKVKTIVEVSVSEGSLNFRPWLQLGECSLRRIPESTHRNQWQLSSYLDNAVDFENDSAYALRLPLIGVEFDDLAVFYQNTFLTAWVSWDPRDFHVPSPGYKPTALPDAVKQRDGSIIVPQGYYVPPFNRDLFRQVRGCPVKIMFGLV